MSTPAPGWYPAPHANNEQQYWDGHQWTSPPPPTPRSAALRPVAPEVRRARLLESIATAVQGGWRLEAQGEDYAVIASGSRPNHILHLLLTIFTAGLWAIVWIIVGLSSGETRKTIRVDAYGNVTYT